MSNELEALVRMVDQIAANQPHLDDAEAVDVVATHLRQFWTPGMRKQLQDAVDVGAVDVSPVARAAVERLRAGAAASR